MGRRIKEFIFYWLVYFLWGIYSVVYCRFELLKFLGLIAVIAGLVIISSWLVVRDIYSRVGINRNI